jgi:IS30 family transposase
LAKGIKGYLTLADHVSKKTLITHVASKHAEAVKDAIITLLKSEKAFLHTINFDNGKVFAYHAKLKEALGVDNYFAHP